MKQLSSLDAQFLAIENPRTYGHVASLAIYDPSTAPGGDLRSEDICRMLSERLHLLPPFRWKLVNVPFGLDQPYWVEDPDFNLDFHVRESAIPPPGTEAQLCETVARLHARPLDRTRPLWEVYVIQGLEDGRVALSSTRSTTPPSTACRATRSSPRILDPSPEGRDIDPPDDEYHGERVPGDLEMLGRGVLGPSRPARARAARGARACCPT